MNIKQHTFKLNYIGVLLNDSVEACLILESADSDQREAYETKLLAQTSVSS